MEPTDPGNTAARHSWDWLFDLPSRLNVVIEVLDARGNPIFPAGATSDAAAVRRHLTADPAIRTKVSGAVGSRALAPIPIDAFDALCLGMGMSGALVLARRQRGDGSTVERRRDLELIAAWLAGAIESTLTKGANAISVEPYRILSIRRILREAASRGSVRKTIGAFVEALSVWDDVRVRAYVAGAAGGFVEYAASIGSVPSSAARLDEASSLARLDEAFMRSGRIVRLSRDDIDRFGLSIEPGDAMALRIITGTDVPWVFLFSGAIDDREQVRLFLYADMLRESLNEVLGAMTLRAVGDVTRYQVRPDESFGSAAQTIVKQLAAAVGGRQAALAVLNAKGARVMEIGPPDLLAALEDDRGDRLVVISSDAASGMTVVVERDQAPFTAIEREIVQAAVAVLHPHLHTALQRPNDGERRRSSRPVDKVFDQLAADAVDAGQQASVIVIALDANEKRPAQLAAFLGRIRAQLRGGDYAGILSDNEIAVLLRDTSASQATVVCDRLKRSIESAEGTNASMHLAIGIRTAESPFEGSLVGAARAGAAVGR